MRSTRGSSTAIAKKRVTVAFALTCFSSLLLAQDVTYPPAKLSPPKIDPQVVLLPESVVQIQWPHTLKLVNAPQSISLLNPGECIRVGIYSTGDNRDRHLEGTKLSFSVQFSGHRDVHPLASPSESKQIKPSGGDFVKAVLGAAAIKEPESIKTMASLGVSADRWCVPADAKDGAATVEVEVQSPDGHRILDPQTIQIETFETGSKKSFKDAEEFSAFSQGYYRQPNPARLLPVLRFLIATQTEHSQQGQAEIVSAFLSAAAKSNPVAAQDFRARIANEPPLTRALGLLILRSAGYDIEGVLKMLSAEEQEKFRGLSPLEDPFDLSPTQSLFNHLDMMWATFEATGEFKPVQTIVGVLGWRADYDDFDKLRKSQNHPSALTPSIVRGVSYTAAGWSLWSFQRNDPLAADYIEYLLASPDTSPQIKSELTGLADNPAFKRPGGQ